MSSPYRSRRPLLVLIAATALGAATWLPSSLDAQAPSRERTLFVSAVDDKGEPVEGLGPDAFVITEDGRRREVLRVSKATEPIDIALLVDNSQAAAGTISFFRESLPKFVTAMAPQGRIAIILLADRPTIATDYTSDPTRLADGIGRVFSMTQSGATLLDAIAETAQGLRKRDTPRAVIVPIVTDGVEFTNRYSKDVTRTLTDAQVALHAVTIGQFYHAEEHSIRERSFLLDEGPAKSGGQRLTLLSPMGLDQTLQRLARELSAQYKVVYGRPESLIPPEKIEVSSGKAGVTMRGAPARGGNGA
jgi:VWFA-related protein